MLRQNYSKDALLETRLRAEKKARRLKGEKAKNKSLKAGRRALSFESASFKPSSYGLRAAIFELPATRYSQLLARLPAFVIS